MSKEITWASSTWLLLHSLTIKMNNNLFLKEKNNILSLFYDICTNLPCPTCSAHAKHVMKEYNFMKISNINQLKDFMFNFHNHVIKNICKCSIGEDETGGAYIGFYHTINNNILDLLEKGESMSAVVKMISNRNDPSKYRRKTAAPKMAHIEKGEKLFADLKNTIHTVEELEMYDHCFKIQSDKASTGMSVSSAFASMRNEAASNRNKNKYSGFAKRCSGKSDTTNLSEISTMSELIEKIKTGEIYDLKISPKTCSNVYTAKTSLDASDLSMPNIGHLWGYLNHESSNLGQRWSSLHFDDSWLDISHFCHIKTNTRENYIMIVKNSRRSLIRYPINSNCCFPEFLAPKHRSVESVFEKLGKMTKVSVPEYSDIGFGKGTSKTSSKNLSSNPRLKINHDIIVTISHP